MNCNLCGKPVILVPSAKERATHYGGTPDFYTQLFPAHTSCTLAKRAQETLGLMRRGVK